jgi:two-component system phosphate regulon sensor histidine kinase PhoR
VINMIDNAVKYSESRSEVRINASLQGGEIVISVQDQGCGIEEQHLPRLFERFYRVDKARSRALGGTGLGLAIVKHIAFSHRGRVEAESEPGRGSTFLIRFPRE